MFYNKFSELGGENHAYSPVCGSDKNASILHYF